MGRGGDAGAGILSGASRAGLDQGGGRIEIGYDDPLEPAPERHLSLKRMWSLGQEDSIH